MKANFGADFYLGVFGTVFGAAFLYQSETLMYPSKVFPVFISIAIIAISILITAQGIITSSQYKKTGGIFSGLGKPAIVTGIAAIYVMSIGHVGFYVASFVCIMVLSIITTRDRLTFASFGSTVIASLVYLGCVYLVFTYALGSSIPSGMLF